MQCVWLSSYRITHKKVPGFLAPLPIPPESFFFEVDKFNMCYVGGVEWEECQYGNCSARLGFSWQHPGAQASSGAGGLSCQEQGWKDLCNLVIEGQRGGGGNLSHQSALNRSFLAQASTWKSPALGLVLIRYSSYSGSILPTLLYVSLCSSLGPQLPTWLQALPPYSCLWHDWPLGLIWICASFLVWIPLQTPSQFTPMLPNLWQWIKDTPHAPTLTPAILVHSLCSFPDRAGDLDKGEYRKGDTEAPETWLVVWTLAIFISIKTEGVVVNFICQLDWPKGCPDSW